MFGKECIEKLLSEYDFKSVLDIGAGRGYHTLKFLEAEKLVTANDIGSMDLLKTSNIEWYRDEHKLLIREGDFNASATLYEQRFDCIWCCHVLEHQLNVFNFLCKIRHHLLEDGVLAITVPPLKHQIVGGHVSLWNAGLLMYNLVLAGFDCSEIRIKKYGYNISAIVRKRSFDYKELDNLRFDSGDIRSLQKYFPKGLGEPFNGDIQELNW